MTEDKSKSFEVTIKHQVSVQYEHDVMMLNLVFSSPSMLDEEGKEITFESKLPIPFLSSGDEAELHEPQLLEFCRNLFPNTLMLLSGSIFRFLSNSYFLKQELLTGSFADAVEAFQEDVRTNARGMVGLPKRGNYRKWTKEDLLARVQVMVNKNRYISWEEINDELKKTDPDKASKNGKALQEVARTIGIGLRDVQKHRVKNR